VFVLAVVTNITEGRGGGVVVVVRIYPPFILTMEPRSQHDLGGDNGERRELDMGLSEGRGGIKMVRRAWSIHPGRGAETDGGGGGHTHTPPLMGYPFGPSGPCPRWLRQEWYG
jgi:hypothetical protein